MAANPIKKSIAFYERGSWYHRTKTITDDFTVKYGKKGGFKTEEEAIEDYEKSNEEFEKRIIADNLNDPNLLLKDYIIYWFEKLYSPRVEDTTRMLTAYAIYNLILPHLKEDMKIKITSTEYIDLLLETIDPICKSAANKAREILNQVFNSAIMDEIISENPVEFAKKYPRKKAKITILSEEELKRFLKNAKQGNWYLEILLGLFLGLRKGEILGLKFCDIDFNERTIQICRQISISEKLGENMQKTGLTIVEYNTIEKDPKTTNAFRILRAPKILINEIEKRKSYINYLKENNSQYEDNDYLSVRPNGKAHSLSALNLHIAKLCELSGVPKITVHGLRHMFATMLIENNVQLAKISGLLGHSSVNTTFNYYCDIMDEINKIKAFMNKEFIPEGAQNG